MVLQADQEEPRMTWDNFRKFCKLQFGPPLRGNPLTNYLILSKWELLKNIKKIFQILLAHATIVRVDQQVDLFTAGLI